ncbi:MAG: IgA Peptidase M64 [marine benthic group bacterium]|nr:IgA Peptidase M64 [Gemmatimonadota bacterium]
MRLRIRTAPLAVLLTLCLGSADLRAQNPEFREYFADRTMRVDYFHTGSAELEVISLDRVVSDGPWAGPRDRLVDESNMGKFRFEVRDADSGALLYSRGFASIYGEWETTAEAAQLQRTFHESLRFPWPLRPIRVILHRRTGPRAFAQIWETVVDPGSRFINAADRGPGGPVHTLFQSGPPSEKVDLVLVGEGYTPEQESKFLADARRLSEALFETEPFRARKSDFNVLAVFVPAERPGVNRPHVGEFRRTPLSTEFNIFDSERYLLTLDNRALREALSGVPYEFVEILVNEKQYGGGGIFNFQSTVAVDSEFADYVFVHEFGHHFAGLADEYYTSDVSYETGGETHPEPWEPNVTALHDPEGLKWGDLVTPSTPIPTPWGKAAYEEHSNRIRAQRRALVERTAPESEFDDLFARQREIERELLSAMQFANRVGAFEGAMYEARGLYRSEIDCIMFTRAEFFCHVCRRAIERIIDLYAG